MVLIGLLSVLIPSCSILEQAESVLKKAGSEYLFKHVPSPPISYLKVKQNYMITISYTPTASLSPTHKKQKGRGNSAYLSSMNNLGGPWHCLMESMMKRGVSPVVTTPWSTLVLACQSTPAEHSFYLSVHEKKLQQSKDTGLQW
jgi:hypothetical protein